MSTAIKLSEIKQLIPPNPSALDFEKKFRDNLDTFLSSMQKFEGDFDSALSSITSAGGDGGDLTAAFTNLVNNTDVPTQAILQVLRGDGSGAQSWVYTSADGATTYTVTGGDSNLQFANLKEKTDDIDSKISDLDTNKAELTDFNNLLSEVNAAHRTGSDDLNTRFTDLDALLSNAITANLSSVDASKLNTGGAFDKLEDRFAEVELVSKESSDEIDQAHRSSVVNDNLNLRFGDIETLLNDSITTQINTANIPASDLNANSEFDSIPLRFSSVESRSQALETSIVNGYDLKADGTSTGYLSLQGRFQAIEASISSANSNFSNFANLSGSSSQDFDIQNLGVYGVIDFPNNTGVISGLVAATNNDEAVNLGQVNTILGNYANLSGSTSQIFEVDTIDKTQTGIDNQAVNKLFADTNYAALNGVATEDFAAAKLEINGDFDTKGQTFLNLKTPAIDGDPVTLKYLTDNYQTAVDADSEFAQKNGDAVELFELLDPTDGDSTHDKYAFSRGYADLRYAQIGGSNTEDFLTKNLDIHGQVTFHSTSALDMNNTEIINLKPITSSSNINSATNKAYVDNIYTNLDGRVGVLENGAKLPSTTGFNAKFLMVKTDGSGITWADPPDLDPSLMVSTPYDWVPSVPWQSIQFDGEVYSSRTLAPGFTYFVAGDLRIAPFDSAGNAVELTIGSGSGALDGLGNPIKGAILIVQGHVIGNLAGIKIDTVSPHKGIVKILNWSDTKADYVIPEVSGTTNQLLTSTLNLTGTHHFPSKLVMEANTELVIDTACRLIFEKNDLDPSSVITINNDSSGNPIGSIEYFDPIKIIEGAPAAYDTLLEIADKLENTDGSSFTELIAQNQNDIAANTNDIAANTNDIAANTNDIINLKGEVDATYGTSTSPSWWLGFTIYDSSNMPIVKNDPTSLIDRIDRSDSYLANKIQAVETELGNVGIGNLSYYVDTDGTQVYKFIP